MGDQIITDLETLLKNLDDTKIINKSLSVADYNERIKSVKNYLCVKNKEKEALKLLEDLLSDNVQTIHRDVLSIIEDDTIPKRLKISILDGIFKHSIALITSSNSSEANIVYETWKQFSLDKFQEIVSNIGPGSGVIKFSESLLDEILPAIMSCEDMKLRHTFIDISTFLMEIYPISQLNQESYNSFLIKLPSVFNKTVNLQKTGSQAWKDVFHLLLKYLDQKFVNPEVQDIFNNVSIDWGALRNDLETNLSNECLKYISDNNLNELTRVYEDWKTLDLKKFTDVLKSLCTNGDSCLKCKSFLMETLIPVIMSTSNVTNILKVSQIDLALEFAAVLPISCLNDEEYAKFSKNVNDYIKNISDLRDNQFGSWQKLWMFLVRLLGRKLHQSMSLINRLLRVVEHAFRNSTFEQRLKGYDCWKELIDNVSLDLHHLSSDKQIRLLLTPLRAKFSRQEIVTIKRFDVFIYLIEKLQGKAVLVLKEFMEFCFGEVSEDADPHKAGQGKSFPGLWMRSAKVLLGFVGHCHESNEECLDVSSEINLKKPVLNENNISTYCPIIFNSVVECCVLLKDVEMKQQRHAVIKCLWSSLLDKISKTKPEQKQQCLDSLCKSFEKLLKENDPYCNSIGVTLFKCILNLDQENALCVTLNSLKPMLKIVFTVTLGVEGCIKMEKFKTLLSIAEKENRAEIQGALCGGFTKHKTVPENVDYVASLWLMLASELDENVHGKIMDFFIWPALYMQQITDSDKQALVYDNYKQVVSKVVDKSTDLHVSLFKSFEKCLRNNPLLLKNILTLLPMFKPNVNNKETSCGTLELLYFILVTPFTGEIDFKLESIESYLKIIYDLNLSEIQDSDLIKKLCSCTEVLLNAKRFSVLSYFSKTIDSLPDNILAIHAKYLNLSFFIDLLESENNLENIENINKIVEKLQNVKLPETKIDLKQFMPIGGRSAKIANLIKQIPASPVKNKTSPSTLRLFGKNIETMSPLTVKGSHLNHTPISSIMKPPASTKVEKRNKKTCSIDDESNSKFVPIDSEVKLKPEMLTEHQKETLKKRREDIPALYQDLSQSLDSNSVSLIKVEDTQPVVEDSKKNDINFESITTEINGIEEDGKLKAKPSELKNLVMNIVGADEFTCAGERKKRREKKTDGEDEEQISGSNDADVQSAHTELNPEISTLEETENIVENSKENDIPIPTPPESTSHEAEITPKTGTKRRGRPRKKSENDSSSAESSFESKMKNDPADGKDSLKVIISITPPGGKNKRGRKPGPTLGKSRVSAEGIRKSTRKSIPTEKYSQMVKEAPDNQPNNEDPEKPPANPTDHEVISDQEETPLASRLKNSDKKQHIKRGRKRRRSTDNESESEDCIESSQDASVSRLNITTLRHSLTKKESNIKETKQIHETADSLDDDATNKADISRSENLFVSDDENKLDRNLVINIKRKRPSKSNSPSKNRSKTSPNVNISQEVVSKHLDEVINEVATFGGKLHKRKKRKEEKPPTSKYNKSPEIVVPATKSETVVQSTQSQDTQTQETESAETGSDNDHLQLDVPQKVQLNESDKNIAQMETASLPLGSLSDLQEHFDNKTLTNTTEIGDNTIAELGSENVIQETESHKSPDKTTEVTDIPSSPVTGDTPSRNSELFNDTLDISPISQREIEKMQSDEELDEIPTKLVPVALKFDSEETEHENNKEKSPEKADDAPDKPDKDAEKNTFEKAMPNRDNISERSKKFIDTIQGSHSLLKRRRKLNTMSPSASRIKKLMSNVKTSSTGDTVTIVNKDDILTFSREVPSPLAVPRSSILKRKHSEALEDSFSPLAKRKRVNFSDPCTTSQKIFIRDDNNTQTNFLAYSSEEIDREFVAVLGGNISEGTETEVVDTEEGLQVNNAFLLRDDRPIYSELVTCSNDVEVIVKKLAGPMFVAALLAKLRNKGVTTVGDLAKMSEVEISRYPFKSPVVTNVYKVLDKYYNKNCKQQNDEKVDDDVLKHDEEIDIGDNLIDAVERAKSAGSTPETICSLVYPLLDQNQLLTYTQSYFNLQTKESPAESGAAVETEVVAAAEAAAPPEPQQSSEDKTNLLEQLRVITDKLIVVCPQEVMQLTINTLQILQNTIFNK